LRVSASGDRSRSSDKLFGSDVGTVEARERQAKTSRQLTRDRLDGGDEL